MSSDRFDVVVVGAGVMGSATAYALARSGHSVLLIEQFELGHKRGSSHGPSRIFRISYPDRDHVAMAIEARELWRKLEVDTGHELLTTTGGLDSGEGIEDNATALEAFDIPHAILSPGEVSERFPTVRIPSDTKAVFQPDAGIVAADSAVATFQREAEAAGAVIRSRVRVDRIEPTGDTVRVLAAFGNVDAAAVVVTAGAWVAGLLAPVGFEVPVRPTRETVAYFALEGHVPTLVEWGDPTIYALPSPGEGIKAGEHIAGPPTDPDSDGAVNTLSLETLREWVAERFPGAARNEHHSETCLYTNTEDENFILERHDRIVIGSPCSGHGFKFAPLIGERLAGLAREVL